jgi:hypothetical protein
MTRAAASVDPGRAIVHGRMGRTGPPDHVAEGDRPDILRRIGDAHVNLAIWRRTLPSGLPPVGSLASWSGARGRVRRDLADEDVAGLFAGAPDTAPMAALRADVAALVRLHADVTGLDRVSVRIAVVTGDACRRFHTDRVGVRLLCTYAGPGTEWLPGSVGAGSASADPVAPETVRRLPTGAVGLFKGTKATPHPIVHRSPPLAGTRRHRLLLCIDEGIDGFDGDG